MARLCRSLHLAWEVAQLPLFTLWTTESPRTIAWAVIHGTGGALLIASFTYAVAALGDRNLGWPAGARLARPLALLLAVGVSYTLFSEWRNVYVLGSWAYAPLMPTIFDVGQSPLAQWVVVPLVATLLTARNTRPSIPG